MERLWASDPLFWEVNRERFPQGLEPLVQHARAKSLQWGLWFAPDSSYSATNWRRDADAILKLHRELNINFFKIDALKIESEESEQNFAKLFAAVRCESDDSVTFDFDITAERRFGYFGLIEPGGLFIENRYTDWHNYWPHHTLRAAWELAHWVDPLRLRLEWLNNIRNDDEYRGDPLAPLRYRPDALFATVMFCSPLGCFENQGLPEAYFREATPLIARWKQHREAVYRGTILPIGEPPDGFAWTGFVSINETSNTGYALVFRELNSRARWKQKAAVACTRRQNRALGWRRDGAPTQGRIAHRDRTPTPFSLDTLPHGWNGRPGEMGKCLTSIW